MTPIVLSVLCAFVAAQDENVATHSEIHGRSCPPKFLRSPTKDNIATVSKSSSSFSEASADALRHVHLYSIPQDNPIPPDPFYDFSNPEGDYSLSGTDASILSAINNNLFKNSRVEMGSVVVASNNYLQPNPENNFPFDIQPPQSGWSSSFSSEASLPANSFQESSLNIPPVRAPLVSQTNNNQVDSLIFSKLLNDLSTLLPQSGSSCSSSFSSEAALPSNSVQKSSWNIPPIRTPLVSQKNDNQVASSIFSLLVNDLSALLPQSGSSSSWSSSFSSEASLPSNSVQKSSWNIPTVRAPLVSETNNKQVDSSIFSMLIKDLSALLPHNGNSWSSSLSSEASLPSNSVQKSSWNIPPVRTPLVSQTNNNQVDSLIFSKLLNDLSTLLPQSGSSCSSSFSSEAALPSNSVQKSSWNIPPIRTPLVSQKNDNQVASSIFSLLVNDLSALLPQSGSSSSWSSSFSSEASLPSNSVQKSSWNIPTVRAPLVSETNNKQVDSSIFSMLIKDLSALLPHNGNSWSSSLSSEASLPSNSVQKSSWNIPPVRTPLVSQTNNNQVDSSIFSKLLNDLSTLLPQSGSSWSSSFSSEAALPSNSVQKSPWNIPPIRTPLVSQKNNNQVASSIFSLLVNDLSALLPQSGSSSSWSSSFSSEASLPSNSVQKSSWNIPTVRAPLVSETNNKQVDSSIFSMLIKDLSALLPHSGNSWSSSLSSEASLPSNSVQKSSWNIPPVRTPLVSQTNNNQVDSSIFSKLLNDLSTLLPQSGSSWSSSFSSEAALPSNSVQKSPWNIPPIRTPLVSQKNNNQVASSIFSLLVNDLSALLPQSGSSSSWSSSLSSEASLPANSIQKSSWNTPPVSPPLVSQTNNNQVASSIFSRLVNDLSTLLPQSGSSWSSSLSSEASLPSNSILKSSWNIPPVRTPLVSQTNNNQDASSIFSMLINDLSALQPQSGSSWSSSFSSEALLPDNSVQKSSWNIPPVRAPLVYATNNNQNCKSDSGIPPSPTTYSPFLNRMGASTYTAEDGQRAALYGFQRGGIQLKDDVGDRIIGGRVAYPGEVPYQVALYKRDTFQCGSSLISAKLVITAAHCLSGARPEEMWFRAGSDSLIQGGQVYRVHLFVAHEAYVDSDYDIGLIKSARAVEFGPHVQPILLPSIRDPPIPAYSTVHASGWGATDRDNVDQSALKLHKIILKIASKSSCRNRIMKSARPITDRQICTVASTSAAGLCFGDSGGPLVANGKLVGIVSWGSPCAIGDPDVYTNVQTFLPWIYSKVIEFGEDLAAVTYYKLRPNY